MSSFAVTSHSQPVATAVQLFVVSVIVVPMLETAVINKVASELLLLDSFTSQLPICVSGTLLASTTSTSKFEGFAVEPPTAPVASVSKDSLFVEIAPMEIAIEDDTTNVRETN